MKNFLASLTVLLIIGFSYCTKNVESKPPFEPTKGWWRILAIGNDTTVSKYMNARTARQGVTTEDGYLKIELKYYDYINGFYVVDVTNKQNCNADFQVKGDANLKVKKITPNRKNNDLITQIAPNATETFYIEGLPAIGKVYFKTLSICNWAGNPEWISLQITEGVLPIVYTGCEVVKNQDYYLISWNIDNPNDINRFNVERSETGEAKTFLLKGLVMSDKVTKSYSIKIPFTDLIPKNEQYSSTVDK